jgi:hypothetical protein
MVERLNPPGWKRFDDLTDPSPGGGQSGACSPIGDRISTSPGDQWQNSPSLMQETFGGANARTCIAEFSIRGELRHTERDPTSRFGSHCPCLAGHRRQAGTASQTAPVHSPFSSRDHLEMSLSLRLSPRQTGRLPPEIRQTIINLRPLARVLPRLTGVRGSSQAGGVPWSAVEFLPNREETNRAAGTGARACSAGTDDTAWSAAR